MVVLLKPFRTILAVPGAPAFALAGLIGRLPRSMVGIGIVLLATAASDSYTLAGSVAAAYVLALAGFAPLQARLVDRVGQSRVLPAIAGVNAAALGGLIIVLQSGIGAPAPQALAVIGGAATPQVGSFVRARWTHLLSDGRQLQTAFSLEAMLDEVVFVLGPLIVTFLATQLHPIAGLASTIGFVVAGTLTLAAQRRTEPPAHPRPRDGGPKPALGWARLGPVVVATACLGVLFGAAEIVVVAVTTEQDRRAYAGVLLALWAGGALLAALISGALPLGSSPQSRFRIGATGMALAIVPLPFIDHLGLLGTVLFIAGFAISPTLIAAMGIVERTVPAARRTEGIAWISSGIAGGMSGGAAVVGVVIDAAGGSAGFLVSLAAGTLAALLAWAGPGPRERSGSRSTAVDPATSPDHRE